MAEQHPEIVTQMLARMEEVQLGVFDPDRGPADLSGACMAVEKNGGFWSPWTTPKELATEGLL